MIMNGFIPAGEMTILSYDGVDIETVNLYPGPSPVQHVTDKLIQIKFENGLMIVTSANTNNISGARGGTNVGYTKGTWPTPFKKIYYCNGPYRNGGSATQWIYAYCSTTDFNITGSTNADCVGNQVMVIGTGKDVEKLP